MVIEVKHNSEHHMPAPSLVVPKELVELWRFLIALPTGGLRTGSTATTGEQIPARIWGFDRDYLDPQSLIDDLRLEIVRDLISVGEAAKVFWRQWPVLQAQRRIEPMRIVYTMTADFIVSNKPEINDADLSAELFLRQQGAYLADYERLHPELESK